jgi:hypothetical protein
MTNQTMLKKLTALETELQKLKVEAYSRLSDQPKKKLSGIAKSISLPRLTAKQIQAEIRAYRRKR